MQEAQKASEEARRRLAEIESRLMKLDVEIGTMRDAAEKEGAAEEARIQAAAEEDARKMVDSAEQEIAAAAKAARRQLTAYAADLAVGLAQKQIHVDAATDQALVRNFAGQLGAVVGRCRERTGTRPWLPSPARMPGPSRMWFSSAHLDANRAVGWIAPDRDLAERERGFAAGLGESRDSRRAEAQAAGCDCAARGN